MKLLSARQVWHDAYYTQGTALSDPTLSMSGESYQYDTGKMLHRAVSGRVQSAIGYLPEVHQQLINN